MAYVIIFLDRCFTVYLSVIIPFNYVSYSFLGNLLGRGGGVQETILQFAYLIRAEMPGVARHFFPFAHIRHKINF